MALIGEFDLKYYNEKLFKNETLDTLPPLIARCEAEVVRTKAEFDKGNFGSYDGWADAKAYWDQALERRSIAKRTYQSKINSTIWNMEKIIKMQPEMEECLREPLKNFRAMLEI